MADVALWSGATGAGNGTSWADAYTTLAAVITAQGNNPTRVFVASDHVELTGTTITFPSIPTAVYTLISSDRTSGFPPTVEQSGARIGSTSGTSLTLQNGYYSKGVFWTAGEGSTAARNLLFDSVVGYLGVRIVGGGIELKNTGAGSRFIFGTTSTNRNTKFIFENAEIRFGSAGQGFQMQAASLSIKDGALDGSAITEFIKLFVAGAADVDVYGLNMASAATGMNLLAANLAGVGQVKFDSCKMPAGWTGGIVSGSALSQGGLKAMMINCDSADTNYRLITAGWGAALKTETAVYRTGGASDGVTPISWRIATNANTTYPLINFDAPPIIRWNETTGSPVTVTIEVLTDGVTLHDDDAWLEVQYLDDAGYPLAALVSDERPSQLAAAADQDASTATWTTTGITTPVKQKLSVTFTPQEKGFIQAKVRVAKPSTTIYVCPQLEVA
jgi:hypothetical protein